MTLCNALALLAFQSDAADCLKRIAVLTQLKSCWASGHSDVRVICSADHGNDIDALDATTICIPVVEHGSAASSAAEYGVSEADEAEVQPPIISARLSSPGDVNSDTDVYETPISKTKRCTEKRVGMLAPSSRSTADRSASVVATPRSVEHPSDDIVDRTPSHSVCSICCRRFSSTFRLQKHIRRVHRVDTATSKDHGDGDRTRPSTDVASVDRTEDQSGFVCAICGRQFRIRQLLTMHSVTHTGERPYGCRHPGCDKRFGQSSTRNSHERIHQDARPYVCSECGLGFKLQSILRNHIKSVHGGGMGGASMHQCHVCGKSFKLSGALRTHVRSTHVTDRLYACPECPKRFKTKPQLQRHGVSMHSTERPIGCPCCDRTFTQLCNLRIHMRTHTGERPYACSVCGLAFSHSGSLKGHLAVHRKETERTKKKPQQTLGDAADVMTHGAI